MAIAYPSGENSAFTATVIPFIESFNSTAEAAVTPSTPTQRPPFVDEERMNRIMKEREREAFYATYNVWTGVRTAVTLTLFFLFTVTVILYKSKCKRHRRYELYPSLEDIPGRPLDFYEYWCPTPSRSGDNASNPSRKAESNDAFTRVFEDGPKDALGSAPLPTHLDRDSLSSRYNSFRVKSLPGSVTRINFSRMGSYEREEAMQYATASGRQEYLRVPRARLQSSGSSSDGYSIDSSSYGCPYDSTPMTLLNVPKISGKGKPLLQTGGIDWENEQATAEWLQTIDINVILPTPSVSPCGSVRNISDNLGDEDPHSLVVPTRGRSGSSASVDSRECDTHSIGSDSVFFDEPSCEADSEVSDKARQSPDSKMNQSQYKLKSPSSNKRQVHSFRLPINPKAALSPIPSMLEGKPLVKRQESLSPEATAPNKFPVTSSLSIPLGGHLSGSCERLATHGALLSEYDNVSRQTSSGTLCQGSSFEDDPVITAFTVPVLRRCNSATTPDNQQESLDARFKRADSDVPQVQRNDSTDINRQNSSSSSGSDDISESVSFHLLVPHLSVDCPSADTSRASSPSLSPTPPGSPSFGTSLSVPSHFHRCSSPSRGRLRGVTSDGRSSLKRQYSQYMPVSPREKSPSPFGLPTSFEEDEEAEEEREKQEEERKKKEARKMNQNSEETESDAVHDEESKSLADVATLVIPAPEGYLSSSPEPERMNESRTKDSSREDSIEGEMKF